MITKKLAMIAAVAVLATVSSYGQEKQTKGPKQDRIKEQMKRLDTDKDGRISLEEANKAENGKLKKNFSEIDTNADKYIDEAEMKAFRQRKMQEKKRKE